MSSLALGQNLIEMRVDVRMTCSSCKASDVSYSGCVYFKPTCSRYALGFWVWFLLITNTPSRKWGRPLHTYHESCQLVHLECWSRKRGCWYNLDKNQHLLGTETASVPQLSHSHSIATNFPHISPPISVQHGLHCIRSSQKGVLNRAAGPRRDGRISQAQLILPLGPGE